MSRSNSISLGLRALVASVAFLTVVAAASAQDYFNGFEVNTGDFQNTLRIPSGTSGVPSATGSAFHAKRNNSTSNIVTFWGGYNTVFPGRGYDTSIDVYLNVEGAFANDTRFEWTSAINRPDGAHLRDFVFNMGFYNATDNVAPGAGTNRFVVSASNGSLGWPQNPARNPIAISTTGWYTLKHEFRRIAGDVLEVRLSVLNSTGAELGSWVLSEPTDVIGTTVGGNRYGWWATNGLGDSLFFDNVRKTEAVVTLEGELSDATPILDGDSFEVRVGETFNATFTGTDPDDLDLTLEADGTPPGATFSPVAGTTGNSPLATDFEWSPAASDFGTTANVTVRVVDAFGQEVELSFQVVVPANVPPQVDAIGVDEIELGDGQNVISLFTTIDDLEGADLDYVWKVNGNPVAQDTGVAPGTLITYEDDFPLGTSAVSVEATDGTDTTTVTATIVVDDTVGPVVVVASDMTVPTDAGENFATGVVLVEPAVADNYDGDPTLTNDAPATFPLGTTDVEWTATDSAGNETKAIQRVIVVDEEAPEIDAVADVTVEVDAGEIFATVDLPEPDVTDNVTADVTLTNDAPAAFPIGTTEVTWTATDEAGNESTATLTVTVVNLPPIADAGDDVDATSSSSAGLEVTLDGSGSSDADDQSLTYAWTAAGVTFDDATSATPTGLFPIGSTIAVLTVTDEAGESATANVLVTIDFVGKLVIDTRTQGYAASYYTAYGAGVTTYYSQVDASNTYFATAAAYASYAQAYDAIALTIDYVGESDLPARTAIYKNEYRYYQTFFSFYAAENSWYGYVASGYTYGSDAYYVNAAAAYTGLADFEE